MISLLCYGNYTPLDTTAKAHMCELMVLINHGNTFLEPEHFTSEDSVTPEQLAMLRVRCLNVMAARLPELVGAMSAKPAYLTAALRRVSGLILSKSNARHCIF